MSASLKHNYVSAPKQAETIRFNALTSKKGTSPAFPKGKKKRPSIIALTAKSYAAAAANRKVAAATPKKGVSPKKTTMAPKAKVMSGSGNSQLSRKKGQPMDPEINSRKMEERLKAQSPWYTSLRDPIQGAGARIPDSVGINTATLQCVQKATIATNAQGINGLYVRSPYIVASLTTTTYPINGTDSTSTSTNIKWGAGNSGALDGYKSDWTSAASLRSIAQSLRVVSAAVFAEYEGSTIADQGECTSFSINYETDTSGGLVTYADYQNRYGSSSCPVNKARSRPMVAYFYPVSYNEFEYTDFIDPNCVSYGLVPDNSSQLALAPYWGFGHVFTGLAANTSVEYTMVVNYEFIPQLNTINYIGSSASPIDAVEEQLVEQWITTDTQTGLANNKLVDVQPGSQKVDEAQQGMTSENMFGMLGSLLSEIAPIVLAAL